MARITNGGDLRAALATAASDPAAAATHDEIILATLVHGRIPEDELARALGVPVLTIDRYSRGTLTPEAVTRDANYAIISAMLPPYDALAAKRRMDLEATAEAMLARAVHDPAVGRVLTRGIALALANGEGRDVRGADYGRLMAIADTLDALWGDRATEGKAPVTASDGPPQTVMLAVQVNDPAALFAQARTAYLASGGGEEAGVASFLGTAEEPDLAACLTEMLAHADDGGALDFPG